MVARLLLRVVMVSLRVRRRTEVACFGRVNSLKTLCDRSDACGQGKLQVVGEPGDTDSDEPQRPRAVSQGAVEEAARQLPEALAVVGADRQRRRARADRE